MRAEAVSELAERRKRLEGKPAARRDNLGEIACGIDVRGQARPAARRGRV